MESSGNLVHLALLNEIVGSLQKIKPEFAYNPEEGLIWLFPDDTTPTQGDRDIHIYCVDDEITIEYRYYETDAEHNGSHWRDLSDWYIERAYTIPIGDPKVFEKVPQYVRSFIK